MKKKTKRYEEGGFTFAEMKDEDRLAAAKAAAADIDRRQAEKSKEAGESEAKPTPRAVSVTRVESKPAPKADEKPAEKSSYSYSRATPMGEKPKSSVGETMEKVNKFMTLPKVEPYKEPKKEPEKVPEKTGSKVPYSRATPSGEKPKSAISDLVDTFRRAPRVMKKGGTTKCMSSGGSVSSASKRGDGCAIRGKTKGRMV